MLGRNEVVRGRPRRIIKKAGFDESIHHIILKETEEQQHENMVIPKSLLVSREISLFSFPSIALICVVSHVKGSHLTYTLSSYL